MTMTPTPVGEAPGSSISDLSRDEVVRRSTILNRLTIAWNAVEGIVAIAAGLAASSASLIGFGLDSGIEVSAALVLAWRLRQERHDQCQAPADDIARKLVALSFALLAAFVGVSSILDLVNREAPDPSIPGIVIAALSLVVMPVAAAMKGRLAVALGSQAAVAEAAQTNVCALLSAALLIGLGANAALGWWWADPLGGLFIAAVSAVMAYRTAKASSLEHTCC